MSWAYLNNAFHKKEEVRISPYDRGFLFGDGVYEVIPSYAGKPFLYEEHISRLSKSLNEVSINKPEQWVHLKSIIEDLIVAAHNSAKSQLKTKTTEEISKATGGFGISGFKWPL